MPATQWTITGVGLFAAMLLFCLLGILAYEAKQYRWPWYATIAAGFGIATVSFALSVTPQVHIG